MKEMHHETFKTSNPKFALLLVVGNNLCYFFQQLCTINFNFAHFKVVSHENFVSCIITNIGYSVPYDNSSKRSKRNKVESEGRDLL